MITVPVSRTGRILSFPAAIPANEVITVTRDDVPLVRVKFSVSEAGTTRDVTEKDREQLEASLQRLADVVDRLRDVGITLSSTGFLEVILAHQTAERARAADGWIGQRHWDAIPVCYAAGGLAGMVGYAIGLSPFLGFAFGFIAAATLVVVAYSALRPEVEYAGR